MRKITTRILIFVGSFFLGIGLVEITNAQNSSLLWEISGNGLEQPSYVFGTIHIACESDVQISEALEGYFENTEQTILELDMDDPQLAQQMQQYSINPTMANFSAQLDENVKSLLDEELKGMLGAGIDQLGIMKPFAIYSILASTIPDCEQILSFEGEFVKLSSKYNQEVIGVETVEDQFAMIDKIPTEEQIDWIERFYTDRETVESDMDDLYKSYRSRDIDNMHSLFLESPEFGKYGDLFLYERNKKWIPLLEEQMKTKSSFIAVGAAHLGSNEGVIALLKDKGYTVKPLQY